MGDEAMCLSLITRRMTQRLAGIGAAALLAGPLNPAKLRLHKLLLETELLQKLRPGRAILFSTHITADVEAISDRVLIIHLGRLLADGRLDELAAETGIPGASLEATFAHLVRATSSPSTDRTHG